MIKKLLKILLLKLFKMFKENSKQFGFSERLSKIKKKKIVIIEIDKISIFFSARI